MNKNKKMPLIGISGKAGAGKDLVGVIIQYLVHTTGIINMEYWEEFKNKSTFNQIVFSQYVIKKFADKLKDIVCLLIGCTREQLEDREFKERELGEEWWYYTNTLFNNEDKKLVSYTEANSFIKNSTKWYFIKPTPRILLQQIGTDLFRNQLHPNTWVSSAFANYLNNAWIFTDVRFPNEAESIKDKSGIIIRVERPNLLNNQNNINLEHISEKSLDDYKFNYYICNDSSIENLIEQIKNILIKEKLL